MKIFEQFWRHFNDNWDFAVHLFKHYDRRAAATGYCKVFRCYVRENSVQEKTVLEYFLKQGADPFFCGCEGNSPHSCDLSPKFRFGFANFFFVLFFRFDVQNSLRIGFLVLFRLKASF